VFDWEKEVKLRGKKKVVKYSDMEWYIQQEHRIDTSNNFFKDNRELYKTYGKIRKRNS